MKTLQLRGKKIDINKYWSFVFGVNDTDVNVL